MLAGRSDAGNRGFGEEPARSSLPVAICFASIDQLDVATEPDNWRTNRQPSLPLPLRRRQLGEHHGRIRWP